MSESLDKQMVDALVQRVPYARTMGFEMMLEGSELLLKLPFRDDCVGNAKLQAVHGGLIGSLMEFSAIATVMHQLQGEAMPKIINITVEYLRGARPVDTYAKARVMRMGRQVANVNVIAYQEDESRPVSSAVANFLIKPIPDPAEDSA